MNNAVVSGPRWPRVATLMPFLWLLFTPALKAGDPLVIEPGKGRIVVYGASSSTDHYYDTEGNLKRFDTLGTEFSATVFGLSGVYGISDGVEANVELPIGYFSLKSEERFPDRSIFAPAWLGLGATLRIPFLPMPASFSAMLRIPPGFHNGIYNDPQHPSFLSDGYFQASGALNLGYSIEPVFIKGSIGYTWRDEEPVDQIEYALNVGLVRVEGTGIQVGVNGVMATENPREPARPFYAGASGSAEEMSRIDGGTGRFSTIDRESYVAVSAGVWVNISESVMLTGNYSLRLAGINALVLSGANVGVGYTF